MIYSPVDTISEFNNLFLLNKRLFFGLFLLLSIHANAKSLGDWKKWSGNLGDLPRVGLGSIEIVAWRSERPSHHGGWRFKGSFPKTQRASEGRSFCSSHTHSWFHQNNQPLLFFCIRKPSLVSLILYVWTGSSTNLSLFFFLRSLRSSF